MPTVPTSSAPAAQAVAIGEAKQNGESVIPLKKTPRPLGTMGRRFQGVIEVRHGRTATHRKLASAGPFSLLWYLAWLGRKPGAGASQQGDCPAGAVCAH